MKRVFAAFVVVVAGCKTSPSSAPAVDLPPAPSAVAPSVAPSTAAVAPLVINDRLVDRAGAATVGRVAGATKYDTAFPLRGGTNRYALGDLVVDANTGSIVGYRTAVRVERTGVVRYDATAGATRWSTPLAGVRSVRQPDAIVSSGVAVVAVDETLHAFDDATGRPTWTAPGPADRLATDGTYVFATDCTSGSVPGRALVAIRLADGKEAWRAKVAAEMDPDSIDVDPRRIVVRDSSKRVTVVFDHGGKELYRLHESVQSTHASPAGLLVFTDKRVALIDDTGATKWSRPPLAETFVAGNDVVDVGADLLVGNYGHISDSGVDLVRLDGATGATKWETKVASLGVGHSEYLHVAYLDVQGPKVFVVSQGSAGSFYERVDLATGKREHRCDPETSRCSVP